MWNKESNMANWKRAYNKLAEEFFALQHEFDVYRFDNPETDVDALSDPWANQGCCGQTTFIADSNGVIDRPYLTEGRYTVLIKREGDNV